MTVTIDGPVGIRNRTQLVTNNQKDKENIIQMLGFIPASEGGKKGVWGLFPGPGEKGSCPKELADAIWDFQTFWKKNGYCRVVDGVVDKGLTTIKKLNELTGGELPGPTPEVEATVIDVIVALVGSQFQLPITPAGVFPDSKLTEYEKKKTRRLLRLGRTTNTVREKSAPMIEGLVTEIKAQTFGLTLGKVFIYGSSSGGRNALDLAVALAKAEVPITFITLLDAAWFPSETKTEPDSWLSQPTNPPIFPHPKFKADVELDFFQIKGNRAKQRGSLRFTSQMGGEEIHGPVKDFGRVDLTSELQGAKNDGDAHGRAIGLATPRVHNAIKRMLDEL